LGVDSSMESLPDVRLIDPAALLAQKLAERAYSVH
jgi:hypothetical protein